jgi:uncharacterized membrane protein YccC
MSDASTPDRSAHVGLALRIATAGCICLFLSEWLRLQQAALGVYTCHLAMVLFPYTAFQKVMERLFGRIIGVVYGLLVALFFANFPVLLLVLAWLGQMAFFTLNATGRFAYGALMGGMFLGLLAEQGTTTPLAAEAYAVALVEQLVLASIVIIAVNYATGAERTFVIETGEGPFWPPKPEWLSKGAMVSTGLSLAGFVAMWCDLPVMPTMVSATILAISTLNPVEMGKKAYLRVVGAVLGGGYALFIILLLQFMPYFSLLLLLLFLGMFLAAYGTKVTGFHSYGFMQMGLVLPMVLIESDGGIGTVETALQRLVGILAGLFVSELVFVCWPWSIQATAAPPPPVSAEVVRPGS